MAPTLVIANKAYSSWSMRPWLVMRHFDIAFDEVVIPMGQEGTRAAMLQHAPTGRCPSLRDGDILVWDSLAIVEYLAERNPEVPVWPRDRAARACARSLCAEMHAGFAALRRLLPMNLRRVPAKPHFGPEDDVALAADVARVETAWRAARALHGGGGPFLFGAFCAADAFFAPVVSRFTSYDVVIGPEARAYMAAVSALPAWRDWVAEADAEVWHLARYDVA